MTDPATSPSKELVRRFVEATANHDYDALDDIVHTDFVRHCQATPDVAVASRDQFKQFLRDDETFPDGKVSLSLLVAEGPTVAFYGRFTGTQTGPMGPFPATGKAVSADCSGYFSIRDGKIAEVSIIWDNVAILTQLGHLQPPA